MIDLFTCDIRDFREKLKDKKLETNRKDENGDTLLIFFIKKLDIERAKLLLEHPNTDTLIKDAHGYTAIHWAALAGGDFVKLFFFSKKLIL